ncbi:MAG: DUF3618 domain-containing protein [Actinomycetaceae bacterium]|nr:DUF3618 domain-containing protein [Actinomycetaceae bacterium]
MSNISEEARKAAAEKTAADYEAPEGVKDRRSAAEVRKDIERVREEMAASVNELANRLDPTVFADNAKAAAFDKVEAARARAQSLAQNAAAGDMRAVVLVAGAVLGVVALIARKLFR